MPPWGADPGVVDHDVEAAEAARWRCPHRRIDARGVRDVAAQGESALRGAVRVQVEQGHAGAAGVSLAGPLSRTDAGGAAGHQGAQAGDFPLSALRGVSGWRRGCGTRRTPRSNGGGGPAQSS